MKYFSILSSLIVVGLGCLLAFALIGSYVDANGFLQEPFLLLPIGYLFIFLGLLGFVGFGVKHLLHKKTTAEATRLH